MGISRFDSSLALIFKNLNNKDEETAKNNLNIYKTTMLTNFKGYFNNFKAYMKRIYEKDDIGTSAQVEIERIIDRVREDERLNKLVNSLSNTNTSFEEINNKWEEIKLDMKKRIDEILKEESERKQILELLEKIRKRYEQFSKKLANSPISISTDNEHLQSLSKGIDAEHEITLDTIKNIKENFNKFNTTTISWDGSFGHCVNSDGSINMTQAKQAYEYAKSDGKQVRMLGVVYHSSKPNIDMSKMDGASLKKLFNNYLTELAKNCPEIDCFDILNEIAYDKGMHEFVDGKAKPLSKDGVNLEPSFWEDKLGENYYIDLLVMAREHFPNAKFIYNDFGQENLDKANEMFKVVENIQKYEKDNNIKLLDGIGLQCRLNSQMNTETFAKNMQQVIDKASEMGLEVQITEADVSKITKVDGKIISDDEATVNQEQENVYQAIVDLAKDNPDVVTGVTFGDIADFSSYSKYDPKYKSQPNPDPTLFNLEGNAKYFTGRILNELNTLVNTEVTKTEGLTYTYNPTSYQNNSNAGGSNSGGGPTNPGSNI